MFVAGQIRFTFFGFILDNYCIGLWKNIDRCRQIVKKAMSNIEDSLRHSTVSEETVREASTTTEDPTFNCLNSGNNFRRAWSAENISDSRFAPYNCFWTGVPYFYDNWNWNRFPWNPYYQTQAGGGFYWNNGYPNSNQFQPNFYGQHSEGFVNAHQNVCYSQSSWPPLNPTFYNLLSSQSIDMQRRHCLRRNNSDENVSRKNVANPKILKLLSKRYWEEVRKTRSSSTPGFEFTVMSYNVLAQNLIMEHPYLYKNHNPRALEWEKRWKNLLEEISKMQPDILCLQEVQESHLSGFYGALECMGYKGIYKKRTGLRCDGCAIYYKTEKFNLVECETVEFHQPNVDVLNRDNVAIVAKLSPSSNPQKAFVVATTHLLYNPKRQDVRLAQTQLLLTEIERLSFYCKSGKERYWPIIITGDFNSPPDSTVYELITEGLVQYDCLSARKLDNSKSECHGKILVPSVLGITDKCQHAGLIRERQKTKTVSRTDETAIIKLHHSDKLVSKVSTEVVENPKMFSSGTLSHLFTFKSVYEHGDPDNVEGTTFQDKWLTVDYIFYSGKKRHENFKDSKLQLISRYRLPRRSELGSVKIPNSILGSDHLCLAAKFNLKV